MWEGLPTEVRRALAPPASLESPGGSSASLFPDEGLPPHEKRILGLLKADETTHIDEIVERPKNEMSSAEVFAARFELELGGKVGQVARQKLGLRASGVLALGLNRRSTPMRNYKGLRVWEEAHGLTPCVHKTTGISESGALWLVRSDSASGSL